MQIQDVYKKALTHMKKNSLAQAHVYAATLGQFLMAPVKSVNVDDGRALGSFFTKQKKIIVYCTKFLWACTSQKKESTPAE